jgi:anti-anti-sigma factor
VATTSDAQRWLTIERQVAEDGTPTLLCKGRINLESANMLRAEVKGLSPSHQTILADLSGVDSVDSSGLGSILGTYVSAKGDGCDLVLVNVHPRVKDLLNITRLTSVLGVK